MNRKEIIESGKLELYGAGVLCGRERVEVALQVSGDAALQAELRAIEETMLAALNEGTVVPRIEVKDKVFAAIRGEKNISAANALSGSTTFSAEGKVIEMRTNVRWLAAASMLLLLGLGITSYLFNQKIKVQQDEITALSEKYNSALAAGESSAAALSKVTAHITLINDANTRKIILKGVAAFPESKAIVYWNSANGQVLIDPSDLPAPPGDKQYQLWALLDGKPIDAGVFDITNDTIRIQPAKNIAGAQAFAVTLEQKGGVASPTLSAMYVIGQI